MNRFMLSMLVIFIALFVCPIGYAAVIVDANAETVTAWYSYDPNHLSAQSYMPTMRYLYAVESFSWPLTTVKGEFTVEIWANNPVADVNADPRLGSAPLATATITRMSTSSQPNCWVRWEFAPPIDVESYVNKTASLLIYWKTTSSGLAMGMNDFGDVAGFGYLDGVRYFIVNNGTAWHRADADGPDHDVSWDMSFKTYGSNSLPTTCGEMGTIKLIGDISGPAGVSDCYVNIYDVAKIAQNWIACTDPDTTRCQ